jgi:P27 family predicted phage terminase small subunit
MNLDKRLDAQALEGASVAYARAVEADRILQRDGLIVEDKAVDEAGKVHVLKRRRHPAVDISTRAWAEVRAFAAAFGFTPAARLKLHAAPDPAKSDGELLRILSEPREDIKRVQ